MAAEEQRARSDALALGDALAACYGEFGEQPMPILSMFYGIVVRMYFFDDKQHHAPHVHAECAGDEAVFAILTGEILAGNLASGKTRLVQAWIEIHRNELMDDWQLAVNGEETFKIDPLR